jgi:hypothetical protein
MVYLIDTTFFTQSHRANYPLDIVKSFWEKVKELTQNDKIQSIDKVRDEIFQNEDILKKWINQNISNDFFKNTTTNDVLNRYKMIAKYIASNNQYEQSAKNNFLKTGEADPWLIAYALHNQLDIVTYEVSSPNSKSKIKIPDVSRYFNVRCISPVEMFRELKESF